MRLAYELTRLGIDGVTAQELAEQIEAANLADASLDATGAWLGQRMNALRDRDALIRDARLGWWMDSSIPVEFKRVLDCRPAQSTADVKPAVHFPVDTWTEQTQAFLPKKSLSSAAAVIALRRAWSEAWHAWPDAPLNPDIPADLPHFGTLKALVGFYEDLRPISPDPAHPTDTIRQYLAALAESAPAPVKGGPGSGYHSEPGDPHRGRPGQRGGSLPDNEENGEGSPDSANDAPEAPKRPTRLIVSGNFFTERPGALGPERVAVLDGFLKAFKEAGETRSTESDITSIPDLAFDDLAYVIRGMGTENARLSTWRLVAGTIVSGAHVSPEAVRGKLGILADALIEGARRQGITTAKGLRAEMGINWAMNTFDMPYMWMMLAQKLPNSDSLIIEVAEKTREIRGFESRNVFSETDMANLDVVVDQYQVWARKEMASRDHISLRDVIEENDSMYKVGASSLGSVDTLVSPVATALMDTRPEQFSAIERRKLAQSTAFDAGAAVGWKAARKWAMVTTRPPTSASKDVNDIRREAKDSGYPENSLGVMQYIDVNNLLETDGRAHNSYLWTSLREDIRDGKLSRDEIVSVAPLVRRLGVDKMPFSIAEGVSVLVANGAFSSASDYLQFSATHLEPNLVGLEVNIFAQGEEMNYGARTLLRNTQQLVAIEQKAPDDDPTTRGTAKLAKALADAANGNGDQKGAGALKDKVVKTLSALTGTRETVVDAFIRQWAHTSNKHVISLAIQQTAADVFGNEMSEWQESMGGADDLIEDGASQLMRDAKEKTEDAPAVLRRLVESTYAQTQKYLKENGIESLRLFRGVKLERKPIEGKPYTYDDNPLSSWSTRYATAESFGSTVLTTVIPAARVYATPLTGQGCLGEYEVVVVGVPGKDTAHIAKGDPDRQLLIDLLKQSDPESAKAFSFKGGPGSGYHSEPGDPHRGRPGQRGGSLPDNDEGGEPSPEHSADIQPTPEWAAAEGRRLSAVTTDEYRMRIRQMITSPGWNSGLSQTVLDAYRRAVNDADNEGEAEGAGEAEEMAAGEVYEFSVGALVADGVPLSAASGYAKAIGETLREIGNQGFGVDVRVSASKEDNGVETTFQGAITSSSDEFDEPMEVGVFGLTYYTANKTLLFSELKVEAEYRASGIATPFLRMAAAIAKQHGAEQIKLLADITIGKYAWAKFGFNGDEDTIAEANRKFAAWMTMKVIPNNPKVSWPFFASMREVAEYTIPGVTVRGSEITNSAVAPDATMHVGKAFLLDDVHGMMSWQGQIAPDALTTVLDGMASKAFSIKGGPGSGYFDPHYGRPGKRGGSTDRGKGNEPYEDVVRDRSNQNAEWWANQADSIRGNEGDKPFVARVAGERAPASPKQKRGEGSPEHPFVVTAKPTNKEAAARFSDFMFKDEGDATSGIAVMGDSGEFVAISSKQAETMHALLQSYDQNVDTWLDDNREDAIAWHISQNAGTINGEEPSTYIIKEVVQSWFGKSSIIPLQHAIADEMGVSLSAWQKENTEKEIIGEMDMPEYRRQTVRAVYEMTQARLKEMGITHLRVYRSTMVTMETAKQLAPGRRISYDDNAAAPWSLKTTTVKNWSGYGETDATIIVSMVVPAERVLSLANVGFGSQAMGEVVILGSDAPSYGYVEYAAREAAYEQQFTEIDMGKPVYPFKGGPGSGHFGHEGRPGKQGGSVPRDGAGSATADSGSLRRQVDDLWLRGGAALNSEALRQYYVSARDMGIFNEVMALDTPEIREAIKALGITRAEAFRRIAEARKKATGAPSSRSIYRKDGEYTSERKALHEQIVSEILKGKSGGKKKPTFLMAGGLPGSGKSTMLEGELYRDRLKDHVHLDSDIIKGELARADGYKTVTWQAAAYNTEAFAVLRKAMARAVDGRYDITYDATMRIPDLFIGMMEEVAAHGYRTEIAYADVPLKTAASRAVARFLRGGRFVDPAFVISNDSANIETWHILKDYVDAARRWDTSVPLDETPTLVERMGE